MCKDIHKCTEFGLVPYSLSVVRNLMLPIYLPSRKGTLPSGTVTTMLCLDVLVIHQQQNSNLSNTENVSIAEKSRATMHIQCGL